EFSEHLNRSGQRPPPHTEPARVMAHAEVRVQNNAIDAIVATAQQILIENAQPVRHGRQVIGTLPQLQTAPQGPFFRSPVCEKAQFVPINEAETRAEHIEPALAAVPPSAET